MDPRSNSLADVLRRTAARDGGKVALIAGEVRQTYAELDAEASRVANALAARGVRQGDRVALLSRNCREYVVVVFAAAKLGAVLVPVNFMLTGADVAFVLEHSEAVGLVAGEGLADVAEEALGVADGDRVAVRVALGPERAGWEPYAALAAHPDASDPEAAVADDDPVQLMYTSGTESRPKGAMMTSRSLLANCASIAVDGEMRHDDVEVHALPLFHVRPAARVPRPRRRWSARRTSSCPRPSPRRCWRRSSATGRRSSSARRRSGSRSCARPPSTTTTSARCARATTAPRSCRSRCSTSSASACRRCASSTSTGRPRCRRWPRCCARRTRSARPARPGGRRSWSRRASSTTRAATSPPGELGELVHRSPHATLGYWRDPEKTAESFAGGWFHSGDLGTLDEEGYVTIVDRKKDMIKTGGENVASREVEEVLYEHPAVAECAVFGIRHPYWIEAVTAVVVARDGRAPAEDELVGFCRERLAAFKVPKYVVLADALPKNPSGKILKRELRAAHAGLAEGDTGDGRDDRPPWRRPRSAPARRRRRAPAGRRRSAPRGRRRGGRRRPRAGRCARRASGRRPRARPPTRSRGGGAGR